jgi:predicted PurR-regulated permease PerM
MIRESLPHPDGQIRDQPVAMARPLITQRQIGFWLAMLAVLVLSLYVLRGVLLPFAAGLALGYLLDPVVTRLARLGLNRLGATLLIMVVVILAFTALLFLLLPVLGHQLAALIDRLPSYAVRLQGLIMTESGRLAEMFGGNFLEKYGLPNGVVGADMEKWMNDLAGQGTSWLVSFLRSLLSGGAAVVNLFSLLIVTPVVAFYILLDWDQIVQAVDACIPIPNRATVHGVVRDINRALSGFIRGQSLVCLFLGLWYGIGLSLIGLNFGFLIGVVAGLLSFIPYVGSLTALLLSIGVALVQDWPSLQLLGLALLVVGSGQFLEGNVLSPKLVGASVGLHPVWLMFALFAFGSLFGFTGLLIAVPLAATVGVLVRFALAQYRASPIYRGDRSFNERPE